MNIAADFLPAPVNGGFEMDGYWVWCGSVIEGEDGRFHMFASRWPKHLSMHPGWMVESEVVRADSDHAEGPYVFQEVVLPARGAAFWDGRMTHNPHITKHDDRFILYYTGSTHPFPSVKEGEDFGLDDARCIVSRANKRIGMATATSIFGPWKREEQPILQTRPDKFDNYLTSNPAPCVNEDGSVLLIYKTRSYVGSEPGSFSLAIAKADHYEGPYIAVKDEPLFPPGGMEIEDPFVWKAENGYQMIAKDMRGTVCGELHGGIHAHSTDGINWTVTENAKSYSRSVGWDDGTTSVMGSLERPFLLIQNGHPTHLFAATADGPGGFSRATKTWNMVIPIDSDG